MIQTMRNTSIIQAPVTTKLRQREGLVRPVSQVILRLLQDGDREPVEIARETVLEWMAQRTGKPLPDEARGGASFTMDDVGAQRTEAIAISDPRYWAARLDDADKTVAQRVWITEIGIGEEVDGSALLGCRLQCVTRGNNVAFDRSVPRFIRDVVERNWAELDGRRILVEPWFVETEDQVEELVGLLLYPSRLGNVIVFPFRKTRSNQTKQRHQQLSFPAER